MCRMKDSNPSLFIEIIYDSNGEHWAYDVNTNTNYNPQAEAAAAISAPNRIAYYLASI